MESRADVSQSQHNQRQQFTHSCVTMVFRGKQEAENDLLKSGRWARGKGHIELCEISTMERANIRLTISLLPQHSPQLTLLSTQ